MDGPLVNALSTVVVPLLRCYLGDGSIEVSPVRTIERENAGSKNASTLHACGSALPVDKEAGRFMVGIVNDYLYGPVGSGGVDREGTHIMAPVQWRRTDQGDRPLERDPVDSPNLEPVPWCVTVIRVGQDLDHSFALRARVLAGLVLECVLGTGLGLERGCQSEPCALNFAVAMGARAANSLLLCPCCMRKLQCRGVVRDVPATLEALRRVLSGPALRGVSAKDLHHLREWGYGASGSSAEPVHVDE